LGRAKEKACDPTEALGLPLQHSHDQFKGDTAGLLHPFQHIEEWQWLLQSEALKIAPKNSSHKLVHARLMPPTIDPGVSQDGRHP